MGASFKFCGAVLTALVLVVRGSEAGFSPYVLDPSGPGGPGGPSPFGGPSGPSGPGFGGPPGPPGPPHFYGGPPPFFGGPGPFEGFGGFRPFGPSFQGPPPGFPYRQTFGQFPIQQQPYIGQFPVVDPSKSSFGPSYTSKVPSLSYGPVQHSVHGGASYSGLQVVDPAKSTLFNSYLYQVNPNQASGYQANFNGLQNSVSEQQQQQQQQYQTQPLAIAQNGASLPISYGETFQEEQVIQQPYKQAAPSVAPPAEYAAPNPVAPSPPSVGAYTNHVEAAVAAPAPSVPLDIQSSYSTYQAPLTNYVYQVSKRPYKFPSSANAVSDESSSKDVALSAPSNEDQIVAAPPGVLVPPKTDATPESVEVVVEMTPATSAVETSTARSSDETTTTLAPLTMKERVKGRRKKVSLGGVGGGDKFVFGQRLSRGRSRSPFKNVELDFVDSRDSSTGFSSE